MDNERQHQVDVVIEHCNQYHQDHRIPKDSTRKSIREQARDDRLILLLDQRHHQLNLPHDHLSM